MQPSSELLRAKASENSDKMDFKLTTSEPESFVVGIAIRRCAHRIGQQCSVHPAP